MNYLTREEMVVATAGGSGKRTPDAQRKYDVKILDVYGETASVRTDSPDWIDYLHLMKQDGRWVIANVLYDAKRGSDRTE